MSEILIKSRITPPGLTKGIVHRTRLTELLKSNADKSLLLICTAAGFGKTTLANEFLSAYNLKHAWYYTTSDVNSFYGFFTYVIHSLKTLNNDFGKNSLELVKTIQKDLALSKNFKTNIDDLVATFVNEFMSYFKENTFLVIDDLHNINESRNREWLNYFFDVLFDNLPSNLHFVITTRDIPHFNINKLKAKRRIFTLTSDNLIFDDKEVSELLESEYSIHSSSEDIMLLQSSMHGWITGIHLVLQAYGKEFKNLKSLRKKDYADIFNYFAKDIFENLDEKTRNFLLNTAILENFSTQICDSLLNIDYSENMIHELINRNIFIESLGQGKAVEEKYLKRYNYQELFRLFLLSKLHQLKTKEEINFQFKKLFNYYLANDEIILAINYLLKAEGYSDAVPLVTKNYKMLFDKGNYDVLWEWTQLIPEVMVNTNPYLLYLTGLMYLYFRSDPESSLKYLNEALNHISEKDEVSLLVDCNILKTDTLLLLGKFEHLKKDLKELLNLKITKEERAKLLYQTSRVLYREGHEGYSEMIELLTQALNICNEENIRSLKSNLFSMLGNIYFDWGDLVKAVHYYEQALDVDSDIYRRFRALNNIVGRECILGNYTKAKEYLDKSIELFNRFPSLLFKHYLLRSMAILSFENGDFEESIRKFEELNALLFKNKIKEYAGWNYTCIGEAFYYLQKYDAALKNFEIAQSYIDKNNEYQLLVISYLSVKSSNKIKFQLDTEKTLLDKLNFNKENNLLQEQTQIEFHLADFYLRAGSSDTALKYLKSCLDISSGKQYLSFLESEVVNSRHVFDFAISNNLQKQFVKTIFENVKEKINYEWLSSEYKKRLADEVESLTDLKLYSFGKTEIRLRGTPIKEEKWVRKKSKIILAYLLTKPDMVLNKDKIIDLFLQDVPLENADTIFHNILSNIRSAIKVTYPDYELETALKGTKNSSKQISPVFTVYENKNLSLNKDYNYDSDCREFDRYFNLASSASSKLSEKTKASVKAVNLYNGEFMPGHYDPWCEEMRQNYSNMFQKLCEELISVFYSTGKYEDTIKYAEKLLETDKLHQEAYLKIIESNVKLRKLNSAKDKFSLMLKNYNEELGEKPERQVLSKINDLLADL